MAVTIPFAVRAAGEIPGGRTVFATAGQSYASSPPNLWDWRCRYPEQARHFFALFARREVRCPPELIIEFSDALLIDGKYVLSRERIGVSESLADVWPDEAFAARLGRSLGAVDRGEAGSIADAGPPALHICKEGAGNFFHVLVEIAPKLVHAASLGIRQCRVPLPAEGEKFRELIAYAGAVCGMQLEFIPCPPDSAVHVQRLLWCGPVSQHGARTSPTLLSLADRLLAHAPAANGPPRLYVTRPVGSPRSIVNGDELEQVLRARGYAVDDPARLPFAEQIALFRGAKLVLGPLGAGLANALFAAADARIGMIDPGLCDPCFWDLACLKGQQFTWIFTREVTPFERTRQRAPFSVDVDTLQRALDWFESDRPRLRKAVTSAPQPPAVPPGPG